MWAVKAQEGKRQAAGAPEMLSWQQELVALGIEA